MNRRNVFAAIAGLFGGGVAGAQILRVESGCAETGPLHVCGKPANNQCPVCGTMAEQYRIDKPIENCKDWVAGGEAHMLAHPGGCGYVPSRLARCKRCNAAFWQDAEVAKP